MQPLSGFHLDRIGVRLQPIDVILQLGIFLRKLPDLRLERSVFAALRGIRDDAVLAEDRMPSKGQGNQQSERRCNAPTSKEPKTGRSLCRIARCFRHPTRFY